MTHHWANKKVEKLIDDVVLVPGTQSPRWYDVEPREIAKLLRAERARARRVVRGFKRQQQHPSVYTNMLFDELLRRLK